MTVLDWASGGGAEEEAGGCVWDDFPASVDLG